MCDPAAESRRVPLWFAGVTAIAVVWGEAVHWRASRRLTHCDRPGSEAVVVLGHRNRHAERANALNRWRVRAGLRSIDRRARSSRVVFCGTSYNGETPSEASLMARYAVGERGFAGAVVLEDRSRSTWENVANAIPLIEDVERIKFVSNPLHAQRARLYLRQQRPDLACRVVRAADYRVGEWALLKPMFAVYGLLGIARTERRLGPAEA